MEELKKLNTCELTNELCSRDKSSIRFALTELMLSDKISYNDLTYAYIAVIKDKLEKNSQILLEADTCINLLMSNDKNQSITDRCIHVLDVLGHYKTDSLKKKYKYSEENGAKNSTI